MNTSIIKCDVGNEFTLYACIIVAHKNSHFQLQREAFESVS